MTISSFLQFSLICVRWLILQSTSLCTFDTTISTFHYLSAFWKYINFTPLPWNRLFLCYLKCHVLLSDIYTMQWSAGKYVPGNRLEMPKFTKQASCTEIGWRWKYLDTQSFDEWCAPPINQVPSRTVLYCARNWALIISQARHKI